MGQSQEGGLKGIARQERTVISFIHKMFGSDWMLDEFHERGLGVVWCLAKYAQLSDTHGYRCQCFGGSFSQLVIWFWELGTSVSLEYGMNLARTYLMFRTDTPVCW